MDFFSVIFSNYAVFDITNGEVDEPVRLASPSDVCGPRSKWMSHIRGGAKQGERGGNEGAGACVASLPGSGLKAYLGKQPDPQCSDIWLLWCVPKEAADGVGNGV